MAAGDDNSEKPAVGALLGRGRVADVHLFGNRALKLYHPGRGKAEAFGEAAVLSLLEMHGLPTPRAYGAGDYGGRWGLLMEFVAGKTLGDRALGDPANVGAYLDEMVRLQLLVHATIETRLRSLKARLADNVGRAPGLDAGLKSTLLAKLAVMPDGNRLCHGDFHPQNIIGDGAASTIIDWPDATVGPPAADACRSYLLLKMAAPPVAEPYLERYVAASGTPRSDIMLWLPFLAAARLAEGVPGEPEQLLAMARAAA